MRIGSRRSLFDWEYFDPDAVAYLKKAKITDQRERAAVNQLIVSLKTKDVWEKMERIFLMSPTSEYASTICCKSLTTLTAVNSPTWNKNGWLLDQNTQYLDTNFSPYDDGTYTDDGICAQGVWLSPGNEILSFNNFYLSGCQNFNRLILYGQADLSTKQFAYFGAGRVAVSSSISGLNIDGHIYGLSRSTSNREVYQNGVSLKFVSTLGFINATNHVPTVFIGANNLSGSPSFGVANATDGYYQISWISGSYSTDELLLIHNCFNQYQKAIGRYSV